MNILRYRCLTDYKHSSIFPAIFPFFFFLQEVGISRQLIIWPRNVKSRVGTCKLNLPVADVFYIHTILPGVFKAAQSLKVYIQERCVF